jgi:hypothetical protein
MNLYLTNLGIEYQTDSEFMIGRNVGIPCCRQVSAVLIRTKKSEIILSKYFTYCLKRHKMKLAILN